MDREIIEEFVSESLELVGKCFICVEDFKIAGDFKKFETIGLFLDRIMGAAATLEFDSLAELLKLGKMICYNVAQKDIPDKSEEIVGGVFELLEYLKEFFKLIFEEKSTAMALNEQSLKAKLNSIKMSFEDFRQCIIIE